jgi:hypothetical protein
MGCRIAKFFFSLHVSPYTKKLIYSKMYHPLPKYHVNSSSLRSLEADIRRASPALGLVEETGNQGDFIGRAYRRSSKNERRVP